MNQNVIDYLQENKGKFSQEVLISALQKANYSMLDIDEGIQIVYVENVLPVALIPESNAISFWDFKSKKVYTNASDKWGDFLLGFFGFPLLSFALMSLISYSGLFALMMSMSSVLLVLYIVFMIYLFNRRRFISYGLMTYLIGYLFIGGVAMMVMFFYG